MALNQVKYASMQSEWMACPVCDQKEFQELARDDRYSMGLPTCQCRRCGLAMTNPVPTEEALSRFYRDDYRLYYRKVEKPSEPHIKEYGLDVRAAYTSGFLFDAGLLSGTPKVLDVGCAEGSLLRGIGAKAPNSVRFGVEPNPHFGEYARTWAQATVFQDLADIEKAGVKFDLITINHVLEHVREPVRLLERLLALTTETGAIYVDVPDAARYQSLDDLHIAHLYHFSAASLDNIARRAGLQARTLEKHDPTRHPLSVRAVFVRNPQPATAVTDAESQLVAKRIRRIALLAPAFRLRRSSIGRKLLNAPMRLWRSLRA
jgi:SAM-dependent methyltransferase